MSDKGHPIPILKKSDARDSIARRRSVTFCMQNSSTTNDESETSVEKAQGSTSSSNRLNGAQVHSRLMESIKQTEYGLCYVPAARSRVVLSEVSLQPNYKKVSLNNCQRLELHTLVTSVNDPYNILMIGDVIHGECLQKELENYPNHKMSVVLAASPNKENIKKADFIILLLPLETIGSCHRLSVTLRQLYTYRADTALRCAVVFVSMAPGREQHMAEMFHLHTLVAQHRLSYYFWCNAVPGGWLSVVSRLACEAASSRGSDPDAPPRALQAVLLWPARDTADPDHRPLDPAFVRAVQHLEV